jgi:hypothetical protein
VVAVGGLLGALAFDGPAEAFATLLVAGPLLVVAHRYYSSIPEVAGGEAQGSGHTKDNA